MIECYISDNLKHNNFDISGFYSCNKQLYRSEDCFTVIKILVGRRFREVEEPEINGEALEIIKSYDKNYKKKLRKVRNGEAYLVIVQGSNKDLDKRKSGQETTLTADGKFSKADSKTKITDDLGLGFEKFKSFEEMVDFANNYYLKNLNKDNIVIIKEIYEKE